MTEAFQQWLGNIDFSSFMGDVPLASIFRAVLLLITGFILARLARLGIMRGFSKTLTPQQRLLLRRIVSYTIFLLFLISALREMGFNFGVLLGAAGIVTLAVGFASQTSVSNLISGLFLVMERSVEVGDVITVGSTTGEVLTIDLLSTKLRTFDNLLVRIPNETMVQSEITNLNRFPIRRVDTMIGVAYTEDLKRVKDTLLEVANNNPLCLDEPSPLIIAQGFGESSVDLQFSVWGTSYNYLDLRNSIQQDIHEVFRADGIEIPFPYRNLYMDEASSPLPIKIINGELPLERGIDE